MVLCSDITGLFVLCSSVELIMPETLNSTLSFINNTSNVSELYGNVTNITFSEEPVDNNLTELVRLIKELEISRQMQMYGRPPIIVLGTLGNVLAFIVMRRG